MSLELVRRLIGAWLGEVSAAGSGRAGSPSSARSVGPTCPSCGGRLVRLGFEPAVAVAVFDTSEAEGAGGVRCHLCRPMARRPVDGARRCRNPMVRSGFEARW